MKIARPRPTCFAFAVSLRAIPIQLVCFIAASLLCASFVGCSSVDRTGKGLRVVSNFPGGSAAVEQIDQAGRIVHVRPASNPGRGWEAWWYFKLEGIRPGETITLDVGKAPWATPDRAAFSLDGKTWKQTAPGARMKDRIVYRVPVAARSAWFAWGPPFMLADSRRLIESAVRRNRAASSFVL
ncbi:MAG TPA: M14-type cytosolic carboxypeptidase, partial [Verrucomicrobiae bacterium]